MQEMLLIGSSIHTNIFKSGPDSIKIVMSDQRTDDINAVLQFMESDMSRYVRHASIVN